MGNWFSSDITLKCGSGTRKVNDECVPDNVKFFESLQKYILRELGERSRSNQECEYFGGEYTAGSSRIDPGTGQIDSGSGRCQIPSLDSEDLRIIQQGLCGQKLKSEAEFCSRPF